MSSAPLRYHNHNNFSVDNEDSKADEPPAPTNEANLVRKSQVSAARLQLRRNNGKNVDPD